MILNKEDKKELERLRDLAGALYAGSSSLNLSEAWMDVLLAAATSRPFKLSKKLFPLEPVKDDDK